MADDGLASPLEIAVDEFAGMRAEGTEHAVLDVREPWEVELCGFEGAIQVPLAGLPGRVAELPKDRPLIVVCHHGQRSLMAADFLRRAGHQAARSLSGGVEAWAVEIDPRMTRY